MAHTTGIITLSYLLTSCHCLFSGTGSVLFTQDSIRWRLPWHIDPLIYSEEFELLEVHVGVNGMRLEPAERAARQYSLTIDEVHVILEIPVGAVGGYFKVGGAGVYFGSHSHLDRSRTLF